MTSLLEFRSKVQNLYQKYSVYIEPIFKFIIAIIVFQIINTNIGYDERLKSLLVVLVLSLISAFSPSAIFVLLALIVVLLHVFYVSPILAAILLVILLSMYFLYLYFTPKLGFVLIAIPILYAINLPYIIPILLGLFFTPISIVASTFGVIMVFLLQTIIEVVNMQFGTTIEDSLQIYTYVVESLSSNQEMITTIIIFVLVILATYIVRYQKMDYAFEIAIGVGTLTSLLGFLIADLRLGITDQIGPMIIGVLFSGGIVLVINFFYRALDYSRSEHVQFEDDDYYYYVKAVPKIEVAEQEFNIKRINPQKRRKNKQEDGDNGDIGDNSYGDNDNYDYNGNNDTYDKIDDSIDDVFYNDIKVTKDDDLYFDDYDNNDGDLFFDYDDDLYFDDNDDFEHFDKKDK